MAATFVARDCEQRDHLLYMLDRALEFDTAVQYVIDRNYEGADASLYVFSYYLVGWGNGAAAQRHAYERDVNHRRAPQPPPHKVMRLRGRGGRRH